MNMPKYIDIDHEIQEMQQVIEMHKDSHTFENEIASHAFKLIIEKFQNLPPTDVVPVVHARWKLIGGDDDLNSYYQCSNCHTANCEEEWFYIHDEWKPLQYCPYCGAKMDLNEGEEQ